MSINTPGSTAQLLYLQPSPELRRFFCHLPPGLFLFLIRPLGLEAEPSIQKNRPKSNAVRRQVGVHVTQLPSAAKARTLPAREAIGKIGN